MLAPSEPRGVGSEGDDSKGGHLQPTTVTLSSGTQCPHYCGLRLAGPRGGRAHRTPPAALLLLPPGAEAELGVGPSTSLPCAPASICLGVGSGVLLASHLGN